MASEKRVLPFATSSPFLGGHWPKVVGELINRYLIEILLVLSYFFSMYQVIC